LQADVNGNLRFGGNMRATAARIDLNGPPALAASTPTVVQHTGNRTVEESISRRVPEHEPWNGHLDVSVVDTSSPVGNVDSFSSDTYYYDTPVNPLEESGESTGAFDLENYPEAQDDQSGLIIWAEGVDRRVEPELLDKVREVARRFGQPLTLTSGYRDPARNRRARGARRSQHMLHRAVDVRGYNYTNEQRLELVAIASSVGITGIGVYNDKSLHFDIRTSGPSAWGSGFTYAGIPPYAKATLDRHLAGGYGIA
jgi:hypothetical protein